MTSRAPPHRALLFLLGIEFIEFIEFLILALTWSEYNIQVAAIDDGMLDDDICPYDAK